MSIKNLRLGTKTKIGIVTLVTAVSLTGVAALVPFSAIAQTTADTIAQLTAQIAALQAQLAALSGGGTASAVTTAGACTFTKDLTVGSRGDAVKCLQTYLKISPASGFFGPLTKAAVAKWQSSNGVSPAAGYFGAKSRVKYSALTAGAAAPAPTTGGVAPVVTALAGTGLVVSAPVDQPAATLAPQSAARLPFAKAILTAGTDGDVKVNSVTVERRGLADDSSFDGVVLLDEDGTQIGLSKTLTSEHKVVLNEPFTVKAGTSKTITIAANMGSSLTNQAGQVAKLALVAVDAGTAKVTGSLPVESNGMTINATLTLGSVTMSIGSLDPGAANTKEVGSKGYYFTSVKAAVGSAEDVTFQSIRFNQAGSAAGSDLSNVVVKADQTEYPATLSSDGKYYVANFGKGISIVKGNNIEFSIKGNIEGGSDRTVDMNILRKTDIVVKGNTFGYNIIVGGGSSGSASVGTFSSNQEPFFNAYAATISKGSLRVANSTKVPAGNIPVSVSDTVLGGFMIEAKGEPVQVSSFTLNFAFTGTGTSSNLTNVKLFDENGAIVAGPKDPSSGVVTWTDTWTAPVGQHDYFVKGKLSTTFVTNDSVLVSTDPGNITAKGLVTGLSISPTPSGTNVTASKQTVRAAALAVSVSSTPFPQNVVAGINGFIFATYVFDATNSGEDVRVTSIQLRDTLSASTVGADVNSCILYDGATALNTGSDVVNPSNPSSTTNDITFTLTNNLLVSRGAVKTVDLKCNIASSAGNNSTHSWGTNAGPANIGSTGASTGQSITEAVTTSTGQKMTVKTAGSFTVTLDGSSPSAKLSTAGSTGVVMNVLKFHANDEPVLIKELTLTYATSTASTSDFKKATLWDSSGTWLGDVVWAGNAQFATSTLVNAFLVPKDGDKLLTVKADLGTVGVTASTTAGRLLSIDYDGIGSSTGIGQSSGQKLGSSSGSNTAANSVKIMKTQPTLAKIAVPTTSIPQTSAILYRYSVTADASGDLALYKMTFNVSSSSVNATSSSFELYAYTDSGFSTRAYDRNPLNPVRVVGCVGLSAFDSQTTCASIGANPGSSTASSSNVAFFFQPVTNLASTSEAIVVPAGTTRYFEFRGNILLTGAGTGNSVSVSLLGDNAYPTRAAASDGWTIAGTNGIFAPAFQVAQQGLQNHFIWSPMSTTTTISGATSTTDWTNGFNVLGLPSNNMSVNTFTN